MTDEGILEIMKESRCLWRAIRRRRGGFLGQGTVDLGEVMTEIRSSSSRFEGGFVIGTQR